MSVGASSSASTGSGSGIDLNIIDYFDTLSESYMDLLSEVIDEVMSGQQDALRHKAMSRQEWAEIADTLEVRYDGTHVDYHVAGGAGTKRIFTKKEYGDLFNAPSPLLRPFASKHTTDLADKFTHKMRKALGETL